MESNGNGTALQTVNEETGELEKVQGLTPAQSRVNAVSRAMDAAMSRASTLDLTDDQIAILKADFPDEAFKTGAAGKENLIYIEHPFLRDRFDEAIGMGRWALIRTEPFRSEPFTTAKGGEAARVYATCALVIQGCMVAEAIGDGTYYFNNDSGNYGDAAESAMTQAFRRCAKQFGVGLQAWKKDWCAGWMERHRKGGNRPPQQQQAPTQRQPEPPPLGENTLKVIAKIKAATDLAPILKWWETAKAKTGEASVIAIEEALAKRKSELTPEPEEAHFEEVKNESAENLEKYLSGHLAGLSDKVAEELGNLAKGDAPQTEETEPLKPVMAFVDMLVCLREAKKEDEFQAYLETWERDKKRYSDANNAELNKAAKATRKKLNEAK